MYIHIAPHRHLSSRFFKPPVLPAGSLQFRSLFSRSGICKQYCIVCMARHEPEQR